MAEGNDLPLAIPVYVIVLEVLKELPSLTRDESNLLNRLRTSEDGTAALRKAIEEAPYE